MIYKGAKNMQNELLDDKSLRDSLAKDKALFNVIEELSVLPIKADIAGLVKISEAAKFYRTKTQLITDILKEYHDEFSEDGYKQYSQQEIVNAYTKPFIFLKEITRVEEIRSFIEIEYKDNSLIQIPDRGRQMLTKKAVLRIACFLEGSSIAEYIREYFLENI